MTQASDKYRNNNLFSNYYLEKYLAASPEWKKNDHVAAFEQVKNIYNRESASIKTLNEKQLEYHFFNEIFSLLGFVCEPTEQTHARTVPDYAFFFDRNGLDDARKNKETILFFTNAIAIGEVKQWKVDLDKVTKNEYSISENPALQIWTYLGDTDQKWGILSNGRIWRLYCKARHRDNYLEVHLEDLLKRNDVDGFRFFYYFFRRDAFVASKGGVPFLDRILTGSTDYAKEIGDQLKDNVYWAMKRIAEGFIERRSNHLDAHDPAVLALVQKNTMILLYRFLFLLYAEGKGLLNLEDQHYKNYYSFYRLVRAIKEVQDGPVDQRYDMVKTTLLAELKDLFRMVDQGSEALEITRDVCFIPPYNGGLFDPAKHPELEKWEIGNSYLADAIDLLSRSELKDGHRDFVDYSTLEIRHLGSIYEGLLEYKLKVAASDLVVSDGGWVTLDAYNAGRKQKRGFANFEENNRVKAGHLYLATDKGERKSTGSYYTPDYIVNYIVKNTIGPVVAEKWKEAEQNGTSYIDATLSINVLDPAMGSGHFLVGAVDFLSEKLQKAAQKDLDAKRIPDTKPYTNDWARRDVVSHCIYGVDLNELAVELAKVGLWLTTISRDKPLSFLDHRLKQGNSLIGARLSDLKYYPGDEPKDKYQKQLPPSISPMFIDHLIGKISELEKVNDDTLDEIKKKEIIFNEFKNLLQYRMAIGVSDVYTGLFFGNKIDTDIKKSKSAYYNLIWAFKGNEKEWADKSRPTWFKQAVTIAQEKSLFHWELEFPEIFFDSGNLKENPGWDAVIGNPPYVLEARENAELFRELKKAPVLKNYYEKNMDIFSFFVDIGLDLTKTGFPLSYIVPSYWQDRTGAEKMRIKMFDEGQISLIIDFNEFKVFESAQGQHSSIFTIVKNPTDARGKHINIIVDQTQSRKIQESQVIDQLIKNDATPANFVLSHGKLIIKRQNELDILGKIEENDHFTLDDEQVVRGVDTSPSDYHGEGVFVLNQNEFNNIRKSLKPCELEFIKPFYSANQIDAYGYDPTNHQWLIYTDKNKKKLLEENKDAYPSLIAHLDKFASIMTSSNKPYGLHRPKEESNFKNDRKILFVRKTKYPKFSYISIPYFVDESVYLILNFEKTPHSVFYLLAVFNSNVAHYWFGRHKMQGNQLQIDKEIILSLPVRRISFTTPADRRTTLLNEAKGLYQTFPQGYDPHPLLAFVTARLAAQPEESDVVHDLLAFLAEQMIDMNKEKNAEIKEFLNFVESEIGAPVDTLSNKTLIQEYYAHDITEFIDVLVKNKSKIKEGYNPKSRAHHEVLKDWYDSSVAKLKPLMAKIDGTDALIDQVVYKLYGLTEEEIAVVKGHVN